MTSIFEKNYFSKQILEESFNACSILKLSDEEVPTVADVFYQEKLDFDGFASRIGNDFDIATICLTMGKKGAKVYTASTQHEVKAPVIQVADTIGAGDSFSAAFMYTLHAYGDAKLAAEKGCQLGAFVASQSGALPEYSPRIQDLLK